MSMYLVIKTLHILSACILFGTGIGIAFFMFRSYFSNNLSTRLHTAQSTVFADYVFTLPATIFQPLSGVWLIHQAGFDWQSKWLLTSYNLYLLIGICWLPVVWIQIQLKKQLSIAVVTFTTLPDNHRKLFHYWALLGIPAFISIVAIFFLMVLKPI